MPAPQFRETFYAGMGATNAYLTGTANTTAAQVVAAPGAGKQLRLKAFRFVYALNDNSPLDVTLNHVWLADGATAICGVASIPGKDATYLHTTEGDTRVVVLPSQGIMLTANTALNIDFTATDTDVGFQLNVWYDTLG
ncbi:MAG: hypothetical protein FJ189_14155 [Gammaproteobacteria bacterium]|nr:hypothetical protein [Gammaproteobacteria bacterium]